MKIIPLEKLTQAEQRIAFMASCCERLMPIYLAFSLTERWGDYRSLEEAIEVIWKCACKQPPEGTLSFLLERCIAQAPDTEKFESVFASGALDTISVIVETLRFIEENKNRRVSEVSELTFHAINDFVNKLNDFSPGDVHIEDPAGYLREETDHSIQKLLKEQDHRSCEEHKLILREIQKQNDDIECLTKFSLDIHALRASCETFGLYPHIQKYIYEISRQTAKAGGEGKEKDLQIHRQAIASALVAAGFSKRSAKIFAKQTYLK